MSTHSPWKTSTTTYMGMLPQPSSEAKTQPHSEPRSNTHKQTTQNLRIHQKSQHSTIPPIIQPSHIPSSRHQQQLSRSRSASVSSPFQPERKIVVDIPNDNCNNSSLDQLDPVLGQSLLIHALLLNGLTWNLVPM
jgi:hypothetical protein